MHNGTTNSEQYGIDEQTTQEEKKMLKKYAVAFLIMFITIVLQLPILILTFLNVSF